MQNIKKPGDYKFKRPYFGPFRIREKLSELNYKLEDLEGNPIEKTMNITQLKRINFSDVDSWKKELEQIEKYKIDENEFSDEEVEDESQSNQRREKNNENEDDSSESSESDSERLDRVDQKEKIEKEKENKNKKLEKFYDEIKSVYDIIAGKSIKNVSAIRTQLSRDIIRLHVKNTNRREEFIAQVKKCETSKQLEDLLKLWLDEFRVVFDYEFTSVTK